MFKLFSICLNFAQLFKADAAKRRISLLKLLGSKFKLLLHCLVRTFILEVLVYKILSFTFQTVRGNEL